MSIYSAKIYDTCVTQKMHFHLKNLMTKIIFTKTNQYESTTFTYNFDLPYQQYN